MVTEARIELAERERDRALPRTRDGRGHAEQRVLGEGGQRGERPRGHALVGFGGSQGRLTEVGEGGRLRVRECSGGTGATRLMCGKAAAPPALSARNVAASTIMSNHLRIT